MSNGVKAGSMAPAGPASARRSRYQLHTYADAIAKRINTLSPATSSLVLGMHKYEAQKKGIGHHNSPACAHNSQHDAQG